MRILRAGRRRAVPLVGIANLLVLVVAIEAAVALGGAAVPAPASTPVLAEGTVAAIPTQQPKKEEVKQAAKPPAPAPAPAPQVPIAGKGMWIYQFGLIGSPQHIVQSAVANGLTHLYVRAGTSRAGLHGLGDIARILPLAHAAGLKVIAWYFPYLEDVGGDVQASIKTLDLRSGDHMVDGFAADIETRAEGTKLSGARARSYAAALRAARPGRFLVLVPPRPNRHTLTFYPYHVLMPYFDGVAPMVYWGREHPTNATYVALDYLQRFGKPVSPIGQAYDMGPEGGPKGPPSPGAVQTFMSAAVAKGAVGVSFWSWQHTPGRLWQAIRQFPAWARAA